MPTELNSAVPLYRPSPEFRLSDIEPFFNNLRRAGLRSANA